MITTVRFGCPSPETQLAFYTKHLGMQPRAPNGAGYPESPTSLQFILSDLLYQPGHNDRYWKIGLTLPNLDLAVTQLREVGIEVSDPVQFFDVGYLAHLRDPAGFVIELLQHDFEHNRAPNLGDSSLPLGGAALGLVTLRCLDPEATRRRCEALGMRLLVVEPVPTHGFTLYFYAFTDEQTPHPDPEAVENREWLYRRPYTVLEFQHRHQETELTESSALVQLEIHGQSAFLI